MNSELYSNLSTEIISKLDSYIDNNPPSTNISALSNYQIPISISNLETIKKTNEPSYIYAGDFSSGYYHCNYYRHSNGNIYVMNFYMQKFEQYYLLEEWEKQLKRYETWVKSFEESDKTTPLQQYCMN